MAACTFFGHRECWELDVNLLWGAIVRLIGEGVDTFYVGNQGGFDAMVYGCLKKLREEYPHIQVCVVLAYLPTGKQKGEDMLDTMYPEIEGHPKFAIERRNRWMIYRAEYCICYVTHTWGGAYKFMELARRRGLKLYNLAN